MSTSTLIVTILNDEYNWWIDYICINTAWLLIASWVITSCFCHVMAIYYRVDQEAGAWERWFLKTGLLVSLWGSGAHVICCFGSILNFFGSNHSRVGKRQTITKNSKTLPSESTRQTLYRKPQWLWFSDSWLNNVTLPSPDGWWTGLVLMEEMFVWRF